MQLATTALDETSETTDLRGEDWAPVERHGERGELRLVHPGDHRAKRLLEEIYAAPTKRAALKRVYRALDELLRSGELATCDRILLSVDLDRLDPSVALGLLTMTLPARNDLPHRAALVARLRAHLLDRMDSHRVAELLRGLD